jgi:twinkle protein
LKDLQFSPTELTIWGGDNGSGKSLFLGQLAAAMIKAGEKVCVMSFEMSPEDSILRMMRQAFGGNPTIDQARQWFDLMGGKLYLYSSTGAITPERCFGCCHWAAAGLGCTQIIVDNLMMLTGGSDGDSALVSQKHIAENLKAIAMATRSHIHLVAHLRKLQINDPNHEPTKADIAGSYNVANLADNVILMWRNADKVKAIFGGNDSGTPTAKWDEAHPDVFMKLDKHRKSGLLRKARLWYEPVSMQLCDRPERHLMDLIPEQYLPEDFYTSKTERAIERMKADYKASFK